MNDAGIYIIQRKDSDECYIGSSANVAKRWGDHKRDLCNGKHHSPRLQRVHDKHGASVLEFVILETVADRANLIEREQVWLDRFNPAYNTAPVAGSTIGFKHRAETLARMSVMAKARPPRTAEHRANHAAAMKGKNRGPHSAETRQKVSAANRARPPISDETRRRMSASLRGRVCSDETRAKISAALTGHPCSAETSAKISAANKGHTHSAETRANMSASGKARWARERIYRSLAA